MKKSEKYRWAIKRIRAQILRNLNLFATLGNICAILKEYFDNFFWIGFYFKKSDFLLLGPFQGPPACVKLNLNKGVCAASVRQESALIVPNVHEFPDHIACDERSNSEIVIPVFDKKGKLQAVLDIDSEKINDFDDIDLENLTEISRLVSEIFV